MNQHNLKRPKRLSCQHQGIKQGVALTFTAATLQSLLCEVVADICG